MADIETLDWKEVHERLRHLAADKGQYDVEEGRWLLAGLRARVHVALGCATFTEYVERLFGYSPRFTGERLRVAEALEDLPETRDALETGELCWSAARELTRVATAESEGEWLRAAEGKTAREVEGLVAGHQRGDRPADPIDSGARRHVLRFEVSAETLAEFREAQARIHHHLRPRAEAGGHEPDNLILLCSAHHDAVHKGFLVIEGQAPDGLRFSRADGTRYGAVTAPEPTAVESAATAFQALKQLGFKETLARRSVEAALTHVGMGASFDTLVRAALAETRRHEPVCAVPLPA